MTFMRTRIIYFILNPNTLQKYMNIFRSRQMTYISSIEIDEDGTMKYLYLLIRMSFYILNFQFFLSENWSNLNNFLGFQNNSVLSYFVLNVFEKIKKKNCIISLYNRYPYFLCVCYTFKFIRRSILLTYN